MSELSEVEVEAVSQNDKGFGLKIGGEWYNGFEKAPAKKGDLVSFAYEKKGKWNNIRGEVKVTKNISESKERDIFRYQCLNLAMDLLKLNYKQTSPQTEVSVNDVFVKAEEIYNFGKEKKY